MRRLISLHAIMASVILMFLASQADAQSYREGNFYVGETPYQMYVEYREPAHVEHETPIILIHGAHHNGASYVQTPDGRDGWAITLLQQGWRVYIVDWPGHGRSPTPPDFADMSIQKVIDAMNGLLDQIDTRAVLLTHSMSGPIGWKIAEMRPEKVAAIVGAAPGGPGNDQPLPSAETLARLGPVMGLPRRVSQGEAMKLFAGSSKFPKDAFENYFSSLGPESERLMSERFNREGLGRVTNIDLSKLKAPIAVVTGDQDFLHPKADDEALAKKLGATFIYLPDYGLSGQGHMQMLEHDNEKILGVITDWLTQQGL